MLRTLLAPNASAMTLDGTRTYVVGERRVAIIDPGPDDPRHLDALAEAVGDAAAVILLTHLHPDHAAGADALARLIGAAVHTTATGTLGEGVRFPTDAGELAALATPGHTPDHIAFHWPEESAIFVGDLMMGGLDTALVAPPEGDLRAYLASLDRLERLDPAVLLAAHGPPITDPRAAIERYRAHRVQRLEQVRQAVAAGARSDDELLAAVYGAALDPALRAWARSALDAYLEFLQGDTAA